MRRSYLRYSTVTLACAFAIGSCSPAAHADEASAPLWAPAAHLEPETEMNSPGMLIGGTITAVLGAGALGTGVGLFVAGREADDDCHAAAAPTSTDGFPLGGPCFMVGFGEQIGGTVLMAGGGLLTLVGVPLIIAGAWQVPVEEVEVVVGPSTMGLRGSF